MKRESPLGGEDNSPKPDDLSNAPKLPPKPGKTLNILRSVKDDFSLPHSF